MPKVKSSIRNKISSWIAPYNKSKEIFSTDGKIIYCLVCDKIVSSEKKYFVDHHSETVLYKNALERNNNKKQLFITSTSQKSSNFFEDLCYAFVSANIPMHKLCNPVLKQFLEKHTKQKFPNESTLRKNYILIILDHFLYINIF